MTVFGSGRCGDVVIRRRWTAASETDANQVGARPHSTPAPARAKDRRFRNVSRTPGDNAMKSRIKTAAKMTAALCVVWWVVNPLRWWFPRHDGERNPTSPVGALFAPSTAYAEDLGGAPSGEPVPHSLQDARDWSREIDLLPLALAPVPPEYRAGMIHAWLTGRGCLVRQWNSIPSCGPRYISINDSDYLSEVYGIEDDGCCLCQWGEDPTVQVRRCLDGLPERLQWTPYITVVPCEFARWFGVGGACDYEYPVIHEGFECVDIDYCDDVPDVGP